MTTHASRILEDARQLLGLGFSVIPLDHPDDPIANDANQRGKVPAVKWAPFQQARATEDNLVAWFGNGRKRNIGIVTGAISNIVFVDTDDTEAEAWAHAHLPLTPIQTITAKGVHRGYRHPGTPVPTKARIREGIDIRGDGGYVVAPGSQHVSGHVYRVPLPWPDSLDTVPVFDMAWVGLDSASQPTRRLSATPRSAPSLDRDALFRRARAYLKKIPPAVQGQGGDAHTFQVACRLVRGFDLSDLDALELLGEWNRQCAPPWSDEELAAKIACARNYGEEPFGGRVAARHHERAASSPEPVEVISVGPSHDDCLTDAGAAERFARLHGADVRFDHRRRRWLLWRGHRWTPDADAAITRTTLDFARAWQREAVDIADRDRRERMFKAAVRLERRDALAGLLALARDLKPIADAGDAWDTG